MSPQNEPGAVIPMPTTRLRGDVQFAATSGGDGGGGNMDDILRRLNTVETTVSDVRSQVSSIAATIPHLATKHDVEVSTSKLTWRLVAAAVTAIVGLAGLMAKGFGWL